VIKLELMRFLIAGGIIVLLLIAGAVYYLYPTLYGIVPDNSNAPRLSDLTSAKSPDSSASSQPAADIPAETIIAEGLDTPWAIAFLPIGDILVTERKGTVNLVDKSGKIQPVATINNAKEIGEGGLLGITIDPKFSENNLVYLYYTYSSEGDNTMNRVVKMKYVNNQLTDEQILLDKIPGASNHNGGRIKFGPDNYLYITTGDAQEPSHAQDKTSLAGKILRIVTTNDQTLEANPFAGAVGFHGGLAREIHSLGHRNPQGITWDKDGNLWETEHGPSGGQYGVAHDEVNFIGAGENYGWPTIIGDKTQSGLESPFYQSGDDTWAPGDIAAIGSDLYFSGLRGQALYKINTQDKQLKTFLKGKYGRIREVILGPDNMLYITTSNKDGRGVPGANDDRIIRINPQKL